MEKRNCIRCHKLLDLDKFKINIKNEHLKSCFQCCEKRKNTSKRYYIENKIEKDIKDKEYREKNKYDINYLIQYKIAQYRRQDKNRNRKTDIDFNFFYKTIINQKFRCYYCKKYCDKHGKNCFTLDRKDNDLGHLKENCILSCRSCNTKKNNRKFDIFVEEVKNLKLL